MSKFDTMECPQFIMDTKRLREIAHTFPRGGEQRTFLLSLADTLDAMENTEISDEEIEAEFEMSENFTYDSVRFQEGRRDGAKWYRQALRDKLK